MDKVSRPMRPTGPRHLPPKTALAAVCLFTLGGVCFAEGPSLCSPLFRCSLTAPRPPPSRASQVLLWIGIPLWHSSDYESDDRERGLSLIILGSITFLPGSYASYMLYGAYKRWRGFDYSQVPSYDD
jgi:hypothetical protein